MTKIIDLTHLIKSDMPVFPGTEPPIFAPANTLEKDGFIEVKITMYSHTGTHIDAPAHLLEDGLSLDEFPIEHFIGRGLVIDCTEMEGSVINLDHLMKFEESIKVAEYILLKTGWSKYWGEEKYYQDFPALTVEAAAWLADFNLKGIGIDAISIDAADAQHFSIHHIFMQKGLIIIENLTNLDLLLDKAFIFSCTPLKLVDADGAPTRAVAIIS